MMSKLRSSKSLKSFFCSKEELKYSPNSQERTDKSNSQHEVIRSIASLPEHYSKSYNTFYAEDATLRLENSRGIITSHKQSKNTEPTVINGVNVKTDIFYKYLSLFDETQSYANSWSEGNDESLLGCN